MKRDLWPLPAWISQLPEKDREAARVRFVLNLAASYATEAGTLTALSERLGRSSGYLNVARVRGSITPEVAVELERQLGRERFPRELFNPVFAVVK